MNENQRQNTKEFISKEYPDYSKLWDTINDLMESKPKTTIKYFSESDLKEIDNLMENTTCQNHIRLIQLFIDRLELNENQFPDGKNETKTIYNKVYKDKLQETDNQLNNSVIQYKNEMLENIKRGGNQ